MADETQIDVKEEVAEIPAFDPTKKKKKPRKTTIVDPADESVGKLAEKTENLSVLDGGDTSFVGLKKKKKKNVDMSNLNDESGDAIEDLDDNAEDDEGEAAALQVRYPWEGSDRDYKYEELLGRVFNILRENNPELAGDRRRTVMRPPQVLREGTKKTVFVNLMDLCKTMHRQPDHVMAFLLAELGTSGSLDGQQRLVVKGRFAPKNFEGILRRYINEYVIVWDAKVLTLYFQRRTVYSFSVVRSVDQEDLLLQLRLVLLRVLAVGMLGHDLVILFSFVETDFGNDLLDNVDTTYFCSRNVALIKQISGLDYYLIMNIKGN